MGPKDKVKDDGPPQDAYVANALYKRLCEYPSECMVILEGALVMAGISLLWRDIRLYPCFQRGDEGMCLFFFEQTLLIVCELTCVNVIGKWSLIFSILRGAALKAADRVIGEQEPDVLKIHLEQFLLPVVPAYPTAYVSQPSPSGGSSVSVVEPKKTIRVRVTGRKYMATGGVSVHAGSVAVTATELASSTAGVQVEGVSSAPLISMEITSSAGGEPSLSALISQASAAAAVSCPMPPSMPTTVVAMTTSPVSTPLPSGNQCRRYRHGRCWRV
ncbi:hypothetical protein Hanom_Chr06g00573541 [Helianthus anomalus]